MQRKVFIFIDEFGNSHLDVEKAGNFSHFVYTALVIDEDKLNNAQRIREEISKEFFQGRDLKSSRIGNDDKGFYKRLSILQKLKELDFIVFSLVVDKKELEGEGLKYKKTFYKYFQRIFITQFNEQYNSFEVYADKIGNSDFQRSLAEFINRTAVQRDLFLPDRYFYLADDKNDEPLIQLADFVSGCIGKIFCISHSHPKSDQLFDHLNERLFVEFFPDVKTNYLGEVIEKSKEIDQVISSIAVEEALKFIEDSGNSNEKESIEIVKFLLLIFRSNPFKLVLTRDLLAVVNKLNPNFSDQQLRHRIGYLRDKGVLIASIEGSYGYKIPNCLEDFVGFYNRYLSSIVPMLRRIKSSNDKLKKRTINEVNILSEVDNFSTLQKLIDVIDWAKIKK